MDGSPVAPYGTATFAYDPITQALSYTLDLRPVTTTLSAVRIGASAPLTGVPASGSVTLSTDDVLQLRNGNLQMVVRTTDGELHGVVSWPTPVLSLPVYVAPRPVSSLTVTPTMLHFDDALQASQTITLSGIAITGSQPPTDVVSLVSLAELHTASPRLSIEDDLARYPAADLKYVGVASDIAATSASPGATSATAAGVIYFAIATHANWSSPNVVEFNVHIDIDQDGVEDFVLFNTDQVSYNGATGTSDVFITALKDLRTNQITIQMPLNGFTPAQRNTALYNSNVMLLPVRTNALGLSSADARFSYSVESFSEEAPVNADGARRVIDKTTTHEVTLDRPGLMFTVADSKNTDADGNGVIFNAADGTTIEVNFALEPYVKSAGKGVLVFYHHNQSERRDNIIAIQWVWPHILYLPISGRR
jgi:hypothetical protein